jgi:hypothetical protein
LSLNAERLNANAAAMPTFNQLAETMWGQLNGCAVADAPPGLDPVEVASDYEAVFDRHGLDSCLSRAIVDAAYNPARLHRLLMSLPWADVFTTNWDTLLERAAADVIDRQYAIVASKESLVATHRPRIVKLHGSFPDRRPFIVTKEDFRSYPRTHAAFVNTVQQAVMECSLCLMGFSGKDPNFLAWAGWVNDNLGTSAPPIYLAGVLDLDARQRKVLAHRRVIPIDLGELFPRSAWPDRATRHRLANEWFLLNLAQGDLDPLAWPALIRRTASATWNPETALPRLIAPQDESLPRASAVPACVEAMERYPGWLVCPSPNAEDVVLMLRTERDELDEATRSADRATSSRAWSGYLRLANITCHPIPNDDLDALARRLVDWEDDSEPWFALAVSLLRGLRFAGRWEEHADWTRRLSKHAVARDLRTGELCQERSMAALDTLDYEELRASLASWPHVAGAFRLELARATAFVEAMEVEKAQPIIQAVLQSIRRAEATSEPSVELLSLEAVAMNLERLMEFALLRETPRSPAPYGRHRDLARWECQPEDLFEAARSRLLRATPQQVRQKKSFDVGRSKMSMSSRSPSQERLGEAESALLLYEAALLPFRCGNSTLFADLMTAATAIVGTTKPAKAFSVLVRAEAHEAFEEQFHQRFIARLSSEQVDRLNTMASRVTAQLADLDGASDLDRWSDVIAMAFEARSRLVARLPAESAEALVSEAVAVTEHAGFFDTFGLSEAILHCIERGFEAASVVARERLTALLLTVPLPPREGRSVMTSTWRDPIRAVRLPKSVEQEARRTWQPAVEQLLVTAQADVPDWASALSRLFQLYLSELLPPEQSERFAALFWRRYDGKSLSVFLSQMSYSSLALLSVEPGATSRDIPRQLRTSFISKAVPKADGALGRKRHDTENQARNHLRDVKNILEQTGEPLEVSQAEDLLERVAIWLKDHKHRIPDPLKTLSDTLASDPLLDEVSALLRVHVLPRLAATDSVRARASETREILRLHATTRVSCEYQFLRLGLVEAGEAQSNIVRSLRSSIKPEILSAVDGVLDWASSQAGPPDGLLTQLVLLLERPFGPTSGQVLGDLARFTRAHPMRLDSATLQRLVAMVEWLLEATDLSIAANDDRYEDPDWMADARVGAAFAASVLWATYPDLRARLEAWRVAAGSDYLPDVRRAWLAGQGG